MKKRLLILLIMLLSVYSMPWLLAQEETAEETGNEVSEQTSTAEENEDAGILSAEQADAEAGTEADEDETPAEDDDFVPSAQISEDLSVSFPVDI